MEDELFDGGGAVFGPFEVFADFFYQFSSDLGVVGVIGLCVSFPYSFDSFTPSNDAEDLPFGCFVESGERFSHIVEESRPAEDGVGFGALDRYFGVFVECVAVVGRVLVVVVLDPYLREDVPHELGLAEHVQAAMRVS